MARSMDLIARLIADTKQFKSGMRDAELTAEKGARRLQKVGRSTEALGKQLSRNVSLPIAAVGAAAVKLSLDFEATFSKMQGLAGVSADEVDGLKDSVLGLAGETGKAPQELAEALYFIRSAGLDGAAAIETLEFSAKGAAAGLGSTIEVANAVTNALNAYGQANITAAEATDVLVATAREGKAEAADLAPQFGKLLPVASELGITFDQVGAGLAFLSRSSGSAELSATLLSNVMAKLLKPSKQAIEILGGVGLTLDDVQKSIREDGLLNALLALREQLPRDEFVKFFEDAQAVQGALALTGVQADQAKDVFASLADSAGGTEEAFAKFAETAGFKNAQAFAKLQAALIEIGDILVPIVAELAGGVTAIVGAFDKLPGPVKSAAVAFAGLAAAVGPSLFIGGKLIQVFAGLPGKLDKAAFAMYGFGGAVDGGAKKLLTLKGLVASLKLAGVFVGLAVAQRQWNQAVEDQKGPVREMFGEWQRVIDQQNVNLPGAQRSLEGLTSEIERINSTIEGSQAPWDADYRRGLQEGRDELIRLRDATEAQVAKAEELAAATGISTAEAYKAVQANQDLVVTQDTVVTEINGTAEAFDNATDAAEAYTASLRAQFDPMFGLLDALLQNKQAQADLSELQKSGTATAEEIAAQQREVASTALGVEGAYRLLNAAAEDQPGLLQDAQAELQGWIDKGLISEETAKAVAFQMAIAAQTARDLGGVDPTVTVTADTAAAMAALDRLIARVGILQASSIAVQGFGRLYGEPSLPGRARGGPVTAGRPYLVGEQGPEVFMPGSPGTIIPNGQTVGTTSVVINVSGSDPTKVVEAVSRYIKSSGQPAWLRSA